MDPPTLLELVLQLHGDFRVRLTPFRVTSLQAGVLLFLQRHAKAKVTEAAAALRVSRPTLSEVVKDLSTERNCSQSAGRKETALITQLPTSAWIQSIVSDPATALSFTVETPTPSTVPVVRRSTRMV
jgi:MarR family